MQRWSTDDEQLDQRRNWDQCAEQRCTNSCVTGGEPQRGIVTYGLSANRQNPFAGASHDFFFNTFRRTKAQIFYWLPPMVAGYYIITWATERYVLSTKLATTLKAKMLIFLRLATITSTPRLVVPSLVMRNRETARENGFGVGVGGPSGLV